MSESEHYTPVDSAGETPHDLRPTTTVITLTMMLSFLAAANMFIRQYNGVGAGVAEGVGGAVGSLIPGLVVVGLFQIGERFRNPRSQWKIFLWFQVVALLGQVASFYLR